MSKLQVRNECIINAPVISIWNIITDIKVLHKINPGILKAAGKMDVQGATRTCNIENNGRKGTITERLIELVPEVKTVWTIESDTVGMSNMLKNTRFVFKLERVGDTKTKLINETYYNPANLAAKIMNGLMIRKKIRNAQEQILLNIKSLTEK